MTDQISRLSVVAELDDRAYRAGAQGKVQADKDMVASGAQVADAIKGIGVAGGSTDTKIRQAGDGIERFKRQMVTGYAATLEFERGQRTLIRALGAGKLSIQEATVASETLYRKYGQMVDPLRLVQRGHAEAAQAVGQLNAKLEAQRAISMASVSASSRAGPTAANQNEASDRLGGFRRQNLGYQLQDIGVSLYGGMPMSTVLLQQGSQIMGIYGGNGGLSAALKDFSVIAAGALRIIGPLAAGVGLLYGAYKFLSSNSVEARAAVDETTKALAAQAVPLGSLGGKVSELTALQETYSQAIRDSAYGSTTATNTIIANTEREFAAKRALLELEEKRQQALIKTQQAELEVLQNRLRTEIAEKVTTRLDTEARGFSDPRIGSVPFVRLPDEVTGMDKTREALAKSAVTDQIKELRANMDLTELGAKKLEEALDLAKGGIQNMGDAAKTQAASINELAKALRDLSSIGQQTPTDYDRISAATIRGEKALADAARQRGPGALIDEESRRRLLIGGSQAQQRLGAPFVTNSDGRRVAAPIPQSRPLYELEGTKAEISASEKSKKAYDELVKTARDRIEQMQLEAKTVGEVGIRAQRLAFELDLMQKAQKEGRVVTEAHRKEIAGLADDFERAATSAAKVRLATDIAFERDQLFRSPQDQQIASRLRGAGLQADLQSGEAGQIRDLIQQQELKAGITGFFTDFRQALVSSGGDVGKAFAQSLSNALMNAADKVWDRLFDQMASVLTRAFLGSGNVGSVGFGGVASRGASVVDNALGGGAVNDNKVGGFSGVGSAMSLAGNYRGAGVDPRLTDILDIAAKQTPGFKVDAISGFRAGDPRFHGKGMATDVQLTDLSSGKLLGNYQDASSFASYEKFAQTARAVQLEKYPELTDQFRWGGYFGGGKGKYGALDTMHFDLAGKGMAGGSWESGLTSAQKSLWPGIESSGSAAAKALEKVASSSGDAVTGLGKLGENLSTSFFPSAPTAAAGGGSAGGGLFSWLGGLFGGGGGGRQWNLAASGAITGLFADGTESAPGGLAVVGERGREIVNLPRGSQVVPNHRTEAIIAANRNSRGQSAGSSPGTMQVVIQGANGDAHVRELVRQGVSEGLGEYNQRMVQGGFGDMQNRWNAQKG